MSVPGGFPRNFDDELGVLGERLRAARKGLGLSQRDLARQLDTAVSTVSDIENALVNPGVLTLMRLAEALNMELSDLFRDM